MRCVVTVVEWNNSRGYLYAQSNGLARIRSVRQVTKMYSVYKRQRILHYERMGHKAPTKCHLLQEEGMRVSHIGVYKFLQKYKETRSIERRPGSGRPTKMTAPVRALVERQMRDDDETTAVQLHVHLASNGYRMTLKTVLRCCSLLGWTFRGSAYCQLICQENKGKHLQWAIIFTS